MAGDEGKVTPVFGQVTAGNDAFAAGRDQYLEFHLHLHLPLPAEARDEDDMASPGVDRTVDSPRRDKPSRRRAVMAEWALWGKDGSRFGYEVLRCSKGPLGRRDFAEVIARYFPGHRDKLPQYTIGWIPGRNRGEGYVAVGIHELADADPRRAGDRVRRDASGREIQYVRLFCVRYREMADHRVSYSELAKAVQERQLLPGDDSPVQVELRETGSPPVTRPARKLAEAVATLLLTTDPVCILGTEEPAAKSRLRFIDQVMSLLPYGLRATLSASTWADLISREPKLRLYFADAPRHDDSRTRYVTWGQHAGPDLSREDSSLRLYQEWLRNAGSEAETALADMAAPVRFHPDEIPRMVRSLSVGNLPVGKPVEDLLRHIARALHRGDQRGVSVALRRLKSALAMTPASSVRQGYQQVIKSLELLHDHPGLDPGRKADLYRALLRLAFEVPLSYASYCEIEDSADGQPPDMLRRVILEAGFSEILPFLVAATPEAAVADEDVMTALNRQGIPAAAPLTEFRQRVASVRPAHRATGYDLSVQYLRRFADDPRAELARLGYLADTLEAAFPESQREQQTRLEEALRFAYGDRLSEVQVSELYERQGPLASPAFRAAVAALAGNHGTSRMGCPSRSHLQHRHRRLRPWIPGQDPPQTQRTHRLAGAADHPGRSAMQRRAPHGAQPWQADPRC